MLGCVSSEYQQERKGFWYDESGAPTTEAIALENWARVAHEALTDVALDYHATIREADLAERVQVDSGIRTSRPHERWLSKLLVAMARVHHVSGDPVLTALVVDDRLGWVGERYLDILRATDDLAIAEPKKREEHAARARFECYRWAGSTPADGGAPAAVRMRASRARSSAPARVPGAPRAPRRAPTPSAPRAPAAPARVAATDRPVAVCPRCFMALPATGICDTCD